MPDPNTLESLPPPDTPDYGAIGILPDASRLSRAEHYLLSAYGKLLEKSSLPFSWLGNRMVQSDRPVYHLAGEAARQAGQQLGASGQAYQQWGQGFAPMRGSLTNPVVDRQQLMDVAAGAVPAARVAAVAPGAIRDAALETARGGMSAAVPIRRLERDVARESSQGEAIAPFPQYAREYPPVPPEAKGWNEEKQREFTQRGKSAETEAFMKTRLEIQKDLEKGNYKPYFDIEKRHDVDPKHYPTAGETIRDTRPMKPETYEAHLKEINTPEARKRLIEAYQAGLASGGHDRWYQMGQLEKAFIDELGPEEGRRMFKLRFADAMAATTGGADPRTNLMSSAYGNYLQTHRLPIEESSAQMPVPTSGLQLSGNIAMHGELQSRRFIPYDNPKRHNFSANFSGHRQPSTIDEQMTDLITPGKSSPGDKYAAYEQTLKDAAAEVGVDPRDFQDIAWGGKKWMKTGGKYKGKPMIAHVNEAIERTSRLTGQTPAEVVKGFIHGKTPLYGLTGATVGTGAALKGNTLQSLGNDGT